MPKQGIVALGDVLVDGDGTPANPYVHYVAPTERYAPVGAHVSAPNIAAVATLVKPAGAHMIAIQANVQAVRFTLDGSDPTAARGFRIPADYSPFIMGVMGASIKVIQEAAGAALEYQWLE
jgi:hypothetical protein